MSNHIFIVGSPRSGTTWLANMLRSHPDIGGIDHELTLFSKYIYPLVNTYNKEMNFHLPHGLPVIIDEKEFDDFILSFIERVYRKTNQYSNIYFLDKHPGYSNHIDLINKYIPNAKIIHPIRDGREVVVSMLSASKREKFGANTVYGAIKHWKTYVINARSASSTFNKNYYELFYEDLTADTFKILSNIFDFLDISNDKSLVTKIVDDNSFSKKPVSFSNPKRRSIGSIWEQNLSATEKLKIHELAGDLLMELGYIDSNYWWSKNKIERIVIQAKSLIIGSRNRLKKIVNIFTSKI